MSMPLTKANCAAVIVLFTPWVFTNNGDVIALAGKLAPLMSVALIAHTASLATEGMLLAGETCSTSLQSSSLEFDRAKFTLCWCKQKALI